MVLQETMKITNHYRKIPVKCKLVQRPNQPNHLIKIQKRII